MRILVLLVLLFGCMQTQAIEITGALTAMTAPQVQGECLKKLKTKTQGDTWLRNAAISMLALNSPCKVLQVIEATQ